MKKKTVMATDNCANMGTDRHPQERVEESNRRSREQSIHSFEDVVQKVVNKKVRGGVEDVEERSSRQERRP